MFAVAQKNSSSSNCLMPFKWYFYWCFWTSVLKSISSENFLSQILSNEEIIDFSLSLFSSKEYFQKGRIKYRGWELRGGPKFPVNNGPRVRKRTEVVDIYDFHLFEDYCIEFTLLPRAKVVHLNGNRWCYQLHYPILENVLGAESSSALSKLMWH